MLEKHLEDTLVNSFAPDKASPRGKHHGKSLTSQTNQKNSVTLVVIEMNVVLHFVFPRVQILQT